MNTELHDRIRFNTISIHKLSIIYTYTVSSTTEINLTGKITVWLATHAILKTSPPVKQRVNGLRRSRQYMQLITTSYAVSHATKFS